MKITKQQLKQIIKEEITKVLSADDLYLAEMFPTGTTGLEEKCREAGGQMMANQFVGPDGKPIQLQEEDDDFLGDVKSTGEWTDYTIEQLKKKKDALMKKEKRTADEVKTVRQLNFAINAKQGDYKENK